MIGGRNGVISMSNKSPINNNKDEETGMSVDILAAVLKDINEKLDRLIEEMNSLKNKTENDNKDVKQELDKHDTRIKTLEGERDKPMKAKLLDQIVSGLAYSFGAFLLFMIVMVVLKSFGASAAGILKAFFSTLGA